MVVCSATLLLLTGCHATSDVALWSPPLAANGLGRRVSIATIEGKRDAAVTLTRSLHNNQPAGSLQLELVSQYELAQADPIALVSYQDQSISDVSMLPVARRAGVDYLLFGELLSRASRDGKSDSGGPNEANEATDQSPVMAVSWRVVDVATKQTLWAAPVSASPSLVAERYPDLAQGNLSIDEQLTEAIARETWRLLIPFVSTTNVELASPVMGFGAREVRRINERLAEDGNWATAQTAWQRVLDDHPRQHAAVHNLAIAAVARQDYDQARRLARSALSKRDCSQYQRTLIWIEQRQREYHRAFGLPDPPGGWLFGGPQHDP